MNPDTQDARASSLNAVERAMMRMLLEEEQGTVFNDLPLDATFFCFAPGFTTETLRKVERAANGTNAEALDGAFRAVIPGDWLVVPEEARSLFFDTTETDKDRPFLTVSQRQISGVPS